MSTALATDSERSQRRRFWVRTFWRIVGGGTTFGALFGTAIIVISGLAESVSPLAYLPILLPFAALFGAFNGLVVGLGAATAVTVVVYARPGLDHHSLTIWAGLGGGIGAIPGAVLAIAITSFSWPWIGPTVLVLAAIGSSLVIHLRLRTLAD